MAKRKVELEDALEEEDKVDIEEVDDHDDDHEEEEEDDDDAPPAKKDEESDDEGDGKTGEEDNAPVEKDKKPADGEEDDDTIGKVDEEVDEDEEARRQAKREARQAKKQRAREARDADKRLISSMSEQLRQVQERLAQVDKRGNQQEMAQLEQAITAHNNAIQRAEAAIQDAFTKRDGKAFNAATQAKDELKERLGRLNMAKENFSRQNDTRGQPGAKINPNVINHAKKFAADHSWYNVAGKDEDSRIVQAIDETLYEAGFDPATPEYWTELKSRIKRRLPHRFESKSAGNGADKGNRAGKKKITGKPQNMGGSAKKTIVQPGGGAVLSKARREAMIADGLVPGTKDWNDQVKAYGKWDKTHASKS